MNEDGLGMITDVARVLAISPRGGRAAAVIGSTWTLGILVAGATWSVTFIAPFIGLDPSWWAGLYMGAHFGLHFGTQIVFTYGPLGFLGLPWLYYGTLAVLAFIYQALLHIGLALSVVWALRPRLNLVLVLMAGFLVSVTTPAADVPVALAAIWCLAVLRDDPPRFALPLVLVAGALLGTIELLVELRPGLAVLAMCLLTLLGRGRASRNLPGFLGLAAGVFAALWFAAGQTLGNLVNFASGAFQIVTGYSQAMGEPSSSGLYLVGELVLGALLVLGAARAPSARRARVVAAAVIAAATLYIYKEAAVRADFGHAAIFFATAAFVLIALGASLRPALLLVGLAAVTALNIYLDGRAGFAVSYDPIGHARGAVDQLRLLFSPHRRAIEAFYGAVLMVERYKIPPAMLSLLKRQTVAVSPWEEGAAWAYGLHWAPLPVLQDYSAYTAKLDRLDATDLRSASAPQRILRENPAVVDPMYPTPTIDNRFPGWDPPAATLAMLCNYTALRTTKAWEILGKAPGRCGPARRVGAVSVAPGITATVPQPAPGTLVYATVAGLGVSGLEQLRTLLYRARFRSAVVNGSAGYRLVPGTAGDGLLMAAAPGIDYPRPFSVSPGARTVRFLGVGGRLSIDFYSMTVRPASNSGFRANVPPRRSARRTRGARSPSSR